jgi:hypothetical protein
MKKIGIIIAYALILIFFLLYGKKFFVEKIV